MVCGKQCHDYESIFYFHDKFVEQYGAITSKANRIAFRDDSDYPLLCSLEDVNEDGEVKKADMFYKQTIKASVRQVRQQLSASFMALNCW